MKKKASFLLAVLIFSGMIGVLSACTAPNAQSSAAASTPAATEQPHAEIGVTKVSAVVWGYEWGPAVPKIILEFPADVTGFDDGTFEVGFGSAKRTVTAVYSCDENGEPSGGAGKYVAIEMEPKANEASPFSYQMDRQVNVWADSIDIKATVGAGKSFQVGGTAYAAGDSLSYSVTAQERIVPQTAGWVKDTVEYKEDGKDITLSRAAWAPEGADTDSGKNPLIIWLHGGGEGGTDIDIALLGNEVTALTTENETNVQKYFTADGLAGAYVLAIQTPTAWMDVDGTNTYNHTDADATEQQKSWYTEALWKAITTYVEGNPDVDTSRIYLGGCSNGGYMTVNLMFEHGGYFAAYYPICEAYRDHRISDEMIASVKDYAIWFVLSADDGTVTPPDYALPTYVRLLEAGAENAWLTLTDKVRGTDDPNPSSWMGSGFYDGHWSWIYVFNDQVTTRFDLAAVASVEDLVPENCTATGVNLWEWLAAQKLPEAGG